MPLARLPDRAESAELVGSANAPTRENKVVSVELPPHEVFAASTAPADEYRSTDGVARALVIPNGFRPGPMPRGRICFWRVPVSTKPAASEWLASTAARLEMFTSREVTGTVTAADT